MVSEQIHFLMRTEYFRGIPSLKRTESFAGSQEPREPTTTASRWTGVPEPLRVNNRGVFLNFVSSSGLQREVTVFEGHRHIDYYNLTAWPPHDNVWNKRLREAREFFINRQTREE
ncbi:hypothetical protein TNCV_4621071 [Trichonephila clavipes]|nr:hypothetical protein TNCV_4621071 [Trichonephila clavipes]